MKTIRSIIIIIAIFFAACSDVSDPKPIGIATINQVFSDAAGAISAINGAYAPLNGAYNGPLQRLTELASDDVYTWRTETQYALFTTDFSDGNLNAIWTGHYRGINSANMVIERTPEIQFNEDQGLKDIIIGQAHFLRALYYFNLVRLFGGVPLKLTETKTPGDAFLPRASIVEVYAQIETDLGIAEQLLPGIAAYTGQAGREAGRATKSSANALLAKVHLTQEEWSEAAAAALKVISTGDYNLHTDYTDNFYGINENGAESVFEIQYGGIGTPTSSLSQFYGHPSIVDGNGLYAHIPTSDTLDTGFPGAAGGGTGLIEDFETGDLRKDVCVSDYGIPEGVVLGTGPADPLVNKYFNASAIPGNVSPYNFPVIRYAEVLLIRAEALNEQSAGNAEAIDIVNDQIRSRAGLEALPTTITSDQGLFRDAIRKERRVELAFENHRFFDLNRWGILTDRISMQGITIDAEKVSNHTITSKPQYLYAIPFAEISTNTAIDNQNPGY